MAHPYAVPMAVLVSLAVSAWPARSDEYPTIDVAPVCHGIANQSDLQGGLRKESFEECMKSEQADREAMTKEWSTFSADDKRHCIAETTMGNEASYTDLVTCLEMARDVRALHQQAGDQKQISVQPHQNESTPRRQRSKNKNAA